MGLPTTPNSFDIAKAIFETKVDKLKELLSNNNLSATQTITELTKLFEEVFRYLDKPVQVAYLLDEYDIRSKELFLKAFKAAKENTDSLLYGETKLSEIRTNTFNYLNSKAFILKEIANKITNKSLDISILNNDGRKDVLVAGDDLHDYSKIDLELGSNVEIIPFTGGATLKRTSINDLSSKIKDINVEAPSGSYEGKSHGMLSPLNVVPEGNNFRYGVKKGKYEVRKVPGISPELQSRYEAIRSYYESNPSTQERDKIAIGNEKKGYTLLNPEQALIKATRSESGSFAGLTYEEWEQLAGNFHYERTFVEDVIDSNPFLPREEDKAALTAFTSKITIEHSPEDELKASRRRMIDGNEDTYWQVELLIDTKKEFNRIVFDKEKNTVTSAETFEKILEQVASSEIDRIDLTVSITFEFEEIENINFIAIDPIRFHPTSFPEIISIEYSEDGSNFFVIPEVNSGRYETTLSPDINMELDSNELSFSLAANKYSYSGKALIPFRDIKAKYIRISIKEEVPVPVIYQIVRVLFTRAVTIKKKKKQFYKVKRKKKTRYYSKYIDLSYEQSLFLQVNETPVDEILPEEENNRKFIEGDLADEVGKGLSKLATSLSAIFTAVPVVGILGAIDQLFKGKLGIGKTVAKILGFGSETKVVDSGWQYKEALLIPRFDKARYVIGLREVGFFNYTYEDQSVLISKVFVSPKPISSVALKVDTSFPTDEDKDKLIQYFFSIDNGTTWNPITPIQTPYTTSTFIPQIYRINSELPKDLRDSNIGYVNVDSPVKEIRFKAVLKGVKNNQSVTPVLKSYRLILGVKGSL